MRRLTPRDDDGATLVLVAMCMTVILGMAALVIDVGAVVQERRTLQNGADAAAMAVALDCGRGSCDPSGSNATATALTYGQANDRDGRSSVTDVCGTLAPLAGCSPAPAGVTGDYVRVTLSTSTADGGFLRFRLAPAAGGRSSATVQRSAVAKWGKLGSSTSLPLTVALCVFNNSIGSPTNLPMTTDIVVKLKAEGGNGKASSGPCGPGGTYPGGFSWLDSGANCATTTTAGSNAAGKPGNSVPQECVTLLPTLVGKDIVIPVYDTFAGTGTNGTYSIIGYASFRISGYRFPGLSNLIPAKCPGSTNNADTCIVGKFVKFSTNLGDFTNTGTDFGVSVVSLAA